MATWPNPLTTRWMDSALKERPTKQATKMSYIGLEYFPIKEFYDYDILWDEIYQANRLAGLYAHDGVPVPGDDPRFRERMADITNIMGSRVLSNQTIIKLREAGEIAVYTNAVRNLRAKYLRKVAEKLGVSEDEVDSTVEYLCLQAMQGSITWPPVDENGAAITPRPAYWGSYEFTLPMGFRAEFVQNASTLNGYNARPGGQVAWNNVAATPILDMEVIAEFIVETTGLGMTNPTAIMSRAVLSQLAFNTSILLWIRGTAGPSETNLNFIDVGQLKSFIKTKLGWNIRIYDARWTYQTVGSLDDEAAPTEQRIKFLDEGKVIIIPDGALSSETSYFATAPDPGQQNTWRPGKYTWQYRQPVPPYTTEVGVGIHGFPILRQPRELFILDAYS